MFRFWSQLFALFVLGFANSGVHGGKADGSASKSVAVQHPVTVNVAEPKAMATPPPMSPLKTRVVVVHNNMVPVPIECFQPPDSGTCSKDLARIYYDHETRTCKPFSYTGCGGNANRFQSIKNCYRICHPYRYKIRPKVAHPKTHGGHKGLKVNQIPAQHVGQPQPRPFPQFSGPQFRSLGGPQPMPKPMSGRPFPQNNGYCPPGYPPQYGHYPPQYGFGQQGGGGFGGGYGHGMRGQGNGQPIYHKQAVMSPSGPQTGEQDSQGLPNSGRVGV